MANLAGGGRDPRLEVARGAVDGAGAALVRLAGLTHLVRVRVRVEEELRVVRSRAIANEGAGAGER